jgi:hypothetical protein
VRDTEYAQELCEPATIEWPNDEEGRIERLLIKESGNHEIRFSWWKRGRMAIRPLDLSEDDLILLLKDALIKNVFTSDFRSKLQSLL